MQAEWGALNHALPQSAQQITAADKDSNLPRAKLCMHDQHISVAFNYEHRVNAAPLHRNQC